jgi:hypothetical protein
MQAHPVEQIAKLAKAPANATNYFAARQLHSVDIAFSRGRLADQLPERKGLTRPDKNAIYRRYGDGKVGDLIALELGIGVAKLSQQQRLMAFTGEFEILSALLTRKPHAAA